MENGKSISNWAIERPDEIDGNDEFMNPTLERRDSVHTGRFIIDIRFVYSWKLDEAIV